MWNYEKRLQYPISISTPNAKMASFIISQYGGPDGEMGASMRYLAQRFSFANPRIAGVLTDIGTEELYHPSWILKKLKAESPSACPLSFHSLVSVFLIYLYYNILCLILKFFSSCSSFSMRSLVPFAN